MAITPGCTVGDKMENLLSRMLSDEWEMRARDGLKLLGENSESWLVSQISRFLQSYGSTVYGRWNRRYENCS